MKALETALSLAGLGYWAIPIHPRGATIKTRDGPKVATGKEPIGTGWGRERRTEAWLRHKFAEHPGAGVGICLGPGRGPGGAWLIDVEGDGPQAPLSLLTFLGGEEVDSVAWSSKRGEHNLFTADGERLLKLLAAAGAKEGAGLEAGVWKLPELPGLELRIGGFKVDGKTIKQVQSVIPPTAGDDGQPRKWVRPPGRGDR